MYVYKKSDKNKEKPIYLEDAVRYKSLWNKARNIEIELRNHFMSYNLMFDGEDEETKQDLYNAIDNLKSFRHNLKLKDNMVCE